MFGNPLIAPNTLFLWEESMGTCTFPPLVEQWSDCGRSPTPTIREFLVAAPLIVQQPHNTLTLDQLFKDGFFLHSSHRQCLPYRVPSFLRGNVRPTKCPNRPAPLHHRAVLTQVLVERLHLCWDWHWDWDWDWVPSVTTHSK